MSLHLGQRGELLALKYLLRQGYQLSAKNWRYKRAELDLVMTKDQVLIFVEVKLRKYESFGAPESFVDYPKQVRLNRAAQAYCLQKDFQGEIRFDIISIVGDPDSQYSITHIEDAFFLGI